MLRCVKYFVAVHKNELAQSRKACSASLTPGREILFTIKLFGVTLHAEQTVERADKELCRCTKTYRREVDMNELRKTMAFFAVALLVFVIAPLRVDAAVHRVRGRPLLADGDPRKRVGGATAVGGLKLLAAHELDEERRARRAVVQLAEQLLQARG